MPEAEEVSLEKFLSMWDESKEQGRRRVVKYQASRGYIPRDVSECVPGTLVFTMYIPGVIYRVEFAYHFNSLSGYRCVEEPILDIFHLHDIPLVEGEWTQEAIDKSWETRKSWSQPELV